MFKGQNKRVSLFEQPFIFLLIYSFFLMLFFTQASPLYPLSQWVDSHAFFTVGKGMANGLVPYRDIFEQKGPLLYALHAIAYTFSHTTFLGVYILEAIAMFINLCLAYKISRLYLNWLPSVIVAIFLPLIILNDRAFAFGDSAEEFAIPFLLTFLYNMLKFFKKNPDSPLKWSFFLINGILIGCVFWIKYTLVGGWIGFYFAILFVCIGMKRWRELVNAIVFTFTGLVLASVPWVIYFGIHHAIKDLFDVYIKFNLVTYSSQLSVPGKLINAALIFGGAFNANFENKVLMMIGMIDFLFSWKYLQNKNQKWLFFSIIVFAIVGVYFGGRDYPYYFLILSPFGLFGLISIGNMIQRSIDGKVNEYSKNSWFVLTIVGLTAIFLCFGYNSNMKFSRFFIQRPLPQEVFANIMKQENHPTLLNYSALDGGFYLAADITPNVRYFEAQNIDHKLFPENMDEQNRYIKEGKTQFVVVKFINPAPTDQVSIPHLSDHYKLVAQQDQSLAGTNFRYFLYKKYK
jgi:hypothetical protein